MLQGVAADCKSAEEAHEWFDSITPHHFTRCSSVWLEYSVWGGGVKGSNPFIETNLGRLPEWSIGAPC